MDITIGLSSCPSAIVSGVDDQLVERLSRLCCSIAYLMAHNAGTPCDIPTYID
jgi:hypothetical protein